jgi:hypothetical protein
MQHLMPTCKFARWLFKNNKFKKNEYFATIIDDNTIMHTSCIFTKAVTVKAIMG